MRHGVYTSVQDTSISTPASVSVGIPFVVGSAPISTADSDTRATLNKPYICYTYAEFVDQFGWSDNWAKYTICEVVYAYFKLYNVGPIVVCAVNEDATASDYQTKVIAGIEYIELCKTQLGLVPDLILCPGLDNVTAVQAVMMAKAQSINEKYQARAVITVPMASTTEDFDGDGTQTKFTLAANPLPAAVTAKVGATDATVTYDDDTGEVTFSTAPASGTGNVHVTYLAEPKTYTAAIAAKNAGSFNEWAIITFGYPKLGDLRFHGSTMEAGRISATDSDNNGIPYESPSNKHVPMDSLVNDAGTALDLSESQANLLNAAGICTFINQGGQWTAWGNYTGAYPASSDVVEYFIPVARMFDYCRKAVTNTFRDKVDKPLDRRLLDSINDSVNMWLNGLVGAGYLIGARCELLDNENPLTDLMSGIIKFHIYMTPPGPAQEIDFILEYDPAYLESLFS